MVLLAGFLWGVGGVRGVLSGVRVVCGVRRYRGGVKGVGVGSWWWLFGGVGLKGRGKKAEVGKGVGGLVDRMRCSI